MQDVYIDEINKVALKELLKIPVKYDEYVSLDFVYGGHSSEDYIRVVRSTTSEVKKKGTSDTIRLHEKYSAVMTGRY